VLPQRASGQPRRGKERAALTNAPRSAHGRLSTGSNIGAVIWCRRDYAHRARSAGGEGAVSERHEALHFSGGGAVSRPGACPHARSTSPHHDVIALFCYSEEPRLPPGKWPDRPALERVTPSINVKITMTVSAILPVSERHHALPELHFSGRKRPG